MKKIVKTHSLLFIILVSYSACKKDTTSPCNCQYFGENQILKARSIYNDYILATYSFEYATRDDDDLVSNDWDIIYGNGTGGGKGGVGGGKDGKGKPGRDGTAGFGSGNPNSIAVNTVADDQSLIADLGIIDFDSLKTVPFNADYQNEAIADTGHTYVVHTRDENSDLYSKFMITSMKSDDWIKFTWVRSRDKKTF